MAEENEVIETWAILEIMGHRRMGGFVKTVSVAGAPMLRIDVPEVTLRHHNYGAEPDEEETVPGFTQYYGTQSVYCLTPCSEAAARNAAQYQSHRPVARYEMPTVRALPSPSMADERMAEEAEFEDSDPFADGRREYDPVTDFFRSE